MGRSESGVNTVKEEEIMAVATNALVQSNRQPTFTQVISSESYQKMLSSAIQDETLKQQFVTAIVSAVSSNEKVAACTPKSIISAGLKCVSLGFMPGGDLGDAYLIPYGNTCTLQLGYKGLIRLAQRSGQCKTINMGIVQKGQTVHVDQLTGDVTISGEPEEVDSPAIGYFAFLRLNGSGFEKTEYMTKQQAIAHAARYAKTSFDKETFKRFEQFRETGEGMTQAEAERLESGVYYSNFDQMAMKTVLRRLLLRWAPMSLQYQQMLEEDEKAERGDIASDLNIDFAGQQNAKPEPAPKEEVIVQDETMEKPVAKKARAAKKVETPAATVEDDFFN